MPWVKLGGGVFLRWGFLRCRRWCDGCSGLLRDFLAGPLAGWVPHAPRGVAGAAPEARLQTQTFEVLRVPLDAVYTVGPGKNSSRSPQPASRQDFFCSCYAWGAAPGGGAAAAAAGAWGVEVYVTASSTHIPTAAAALTCNLQT